MDLAEICQAIKDRIEDDNVTYTVDGVMYYGMCHISHDLMIDGVITPNERTMFINEWDLYARNTDKPFYWASGNTALTRGAFGWPVSEKKPRIDWLNERING